MSADDPQREMWRSALRHAGVPPSRLYEAAELAGRIAHAMDAEGWDVVEEVRGFGDLTRGLATLAATVALVGAVRPLPADLPASPPTPTTDEPPTDIEWTRPQ